MKGIICGFSGRIGVRCGKVKSQDAFKPFGIRHWEKRMPFTEVRITVLVAWRTDVKVEEWNIWKSVRGRKASCKD